MRVGMYVWHPHFIFLVFDVAVSLSPSQKQKPSGPWDMFQSHLSFIITNNNK